MPPGPKDTAIIMYTSGSTGVPKGVILSHSNLLSTMASFADAVPIIPGDILMGFLPLAHVFELLAESLCLLAGKEYFCIRITNFLYLCFVYVCFYY